MPKAVEIFARYLNVTTGLVSQWERREKHPQEASLKLLTLVAKNGLQAVAWHTGTRAATVEVVGRAVAFHGEVDDDIAVERGIESKPTLLTQQRGARMPSSDVTVRDVIAIGPHTEHRVFTNGLGPVARLLVRNLHLDAGALRELYMLKWLNTPFSYLRESSTPAASHFQFTHSLAVLIPTVYAHNVAIDEFSRRLKKIRAPLMRGRQPGGVPPEACDEAAEVGETAA